MDKVKYVLRKWDNEVYKVILENDDRYCIQNIKYGHVTKVDKDEVIVIRNM